MNDLVVWYGRLVTRRRLQGEGAGLLFMPVVWLALLLVLPLMALVVLAFAQRGAYGEIVWHLTTANLRRLLGFGILGWTPDYLLILGRSLMLATVSTVLCVVLSYPLAFYVATRTPRFQKVLITLLMVPFCTNLVIRTFGWRLLLESSMPLSKLFQFFGILPLDTGLYPGAFAVYLGMVSAELPFSVLPLYAVVERLDWTLVEAAQDLYASRTRIFLHAILPQTLPGLAVATILTFIPAVGAFVVPDLLGGAKYMLVGSLLQQQFGASRDLPFGAMVSLALLILTLIGLVAGRRGGEHP